MKVSLRMWSFLWCCGKSPLCICSVVKRGQSYQPTWAIEGTNVCIPEVHTPLACRAWSKRILSTWKAWLSEPNSTEVMRPQTRRVEISRENFLGSVLSFSVKQRARFCWCSCPTALHESESVRFVVLHSTSCPSSLGATFLPNSSAITAAVCFSTFALTDSAQATSYQKS